METLSLASIDLADIGLRGGVDMRPTLLRVLTDLYVQKLQHTPEEDRHYTELALRLLEGVDAQTRAAIAARLARHLSPPLRVLQSLVNDHPEIAGLLRSHPLLRPANPADAAPAVPDELSSPHKQSAAEPVSEPSPAAAVSRPLDSAIASELNELFFAADGNERGLILRSLDVVAPIPTGRASISLNPAVGPRLEAAALARSREDFARHLAQSLQISRAQARRIANDNLGEPLVIAAKALGISRDLVYRILLFVNPAVGHSVERVHTLATLYDEMTAQAAEGMVAIWQSLRTEEAAAKHSPLTWNDEPRGSERQTAAASPRTPAMPRTLKRRDAS